MHKLVMECISFLEAALTLLQTQVKNLEAELGASKRKISAMNLDNENKRRKISEIEERQ